MKIKFMYNVIKVGDVLHMAGKVHGRKGGK